MDASALDRFGRNINPHLDIIASKVENGKENDSASASLNSIILSKLLSFALSIAIASFHQSINAPIKMMIASQTPQRQSEIWNAITEAARKHADSTGAVTLQNEVIYVSARR